MEKFSPVPNSAPLLNVKAYVRSGKGKKLQHLLKISKIHFHLKVDRVSAREECGEWREAKKAANCDKVSMGEGERRGVQHV